MSEPVALPAKGVLVHQRIGGRLVVRAGGDLRLTKAGVSHLEVRIKHPEQNYLEIVPRSRGRMISPVGESAHADPDSLEHAVASQLVHDEGGLHLARLLVGVGHKATHKVGLAGVEGGHQLNQGNQVDGGDGLAATLLLLLALLLGGSGGLAGVVFPEKDLVGRMI